MAPVRLCLYAYQECHLECGCSAYPGGAFGRPHKPVARRAAKYIHKGKDLPQRLYGHLRESWPTEASLNEIIIRPAPVEP